jgi:hypothetical protein
MFKTKEFAEAKRHADALYACEVENEVERALRLADELRGTVRSDAESVLATLREHGGVLRGAGDRSGAR